MTSSSEGDDRILVPCRHCTSVSIEMLVERGKWTLKCPKCGLLTTFDVGHGPNGLEIRAHAVEMPPSPEPD